MILQMTMIIVIMRRTLSSNITILLSFWEVTVMTLFEKLSELRIKVDAGYTLSESEILEFANIVVNLTPEENRCVCC